MVMMLPKPEVEGFIFSHLVIVSTHVHVCSFPQFKASSHLIKSDFQSRFSEEH